MKPLSDQNIESELSYAYIHAVASHAGASCDVANRHEDNSGVDATVTGWGPFPGGGYRQEIDIKVQLKATVSPIVVSNNYISYNFRGIQQYDDLRSNAVSTPRILVVLFLPSAKIDWITHTEEALSLCKCAYWVSLRGAPSSTNAMSQTIYIPKHQTLTPGGLVEIFSSISAGNIPEYDGGSA